MVDVHRSCRTTSMCQKHTHTHTQTDIYDPIRICFFSSSSQHYYYHRWPSALLTICSIAVAVIRPKKERKKKLEKNVKKVVRKYLQNLLILIFIFCLYFSMACVCTRNLSQVNDHRRSIAKIKSNMFAHIRAYNSIFDTIFNVISFNRRIDIAEIIFCGLCFGWIRMCVWAFNFYLLFSWFGQSFRAFDSLMRHNDMCLAHVSYPSGSICQCDETSNAKRRIFFSKWCFGTIFMHIIQMTFNKSSRCSRMKWMWVRFWYECHSFIYVLYLYHGTDSTM